MSPQIQVVLIAAACTSAVGLLGLGVMRLLRRASLRLSLQAGSALAVLAIVAGTLGTAETMFISRHDLGVVVMVCVVAGIAAFGFCWLLGRQVETGSLALRYAARSMGHEPGGFRSPAVPMAAELAALSQELAATAAKLDGVAAARAQAGAVPSRAGGLGLPRPAHAAGPAERHGRGPPGRHSRRPGPLPPPDPGRGRPAHRNGGRPVRAVPHPGRTLQLSPDRIDARRPGKRCRGRRGGARPGQRRTAGRRGQRAAHHRRRPARAVPRPGQPARQRRPAHRGRRHGADRSRAGGAARAAVGLRRLRRHPGSRSAPGLRHRLAWHPGPQPRTPAARGWGSRSSAA